MINLINMILVYNYYVDTDNFFLELIKVLYDIIKENLHEFDTSDYPDNHPFCNIKKKV